MRFSTTLAVFVCLCSPVTGQQPLDLFQDVPELDPEFIRLGSWNLRHINVEGQADDFLPGATETEDFQILIATFAEAIDDVGLDIVAISEHQPRQNEANRRRRARTRRKKAQVRQSMQPVPTPGKRRLTRALPLPPPADRRVTRAMPMQREEASGQQYLSGFVKEFAAAGGGPRPRESQRRCRSRADLRGRIQRLRRALNLYR